MLAASGEVKVADFGLAGQSVILARQRDYQKSADLLTELGPLRERLDFAMKQLIAALHLAAQASRRAMSRENAAMLEQ